MAIIGDGQGIKVIKDTTDYILKEVDSVYYYTHGVGEKDGFVLDTMKIHKEKGVLRLPLDNGKMITFIDSLKPIDETNISSYVYKGENRKLNYYLVTGNFYELQTTYLINKRNGKTDTLENTPIFSPSDLFYGYSYSDNLDMKQNITYKNIKENKTVKINMGDDIAGEFKWLNDYQFMYSYYTFDNAIEMYSIVKYMLVTIRK
jgi:hypothetical protein